MGTKVRIETEGLTEILDGLVRMPDAVRDELMVGLTVSAGVVASKAKALIQSGGRSGAVYPYGQASAPGEAPANVTGDLANSIKVGKGRYFLQMEVYTQHPAALIFEYGSKRIASRPFIRPAVDASRQQLQAIMAEAAQRGVEKVR